MYGSVCAPQSALRDQWRNTTKDYAGHAREPDPGLHLGAHEHLAARRDPRDGGNLVEVNRAVVAPTARGVGKEVQAAERSGSEHPPAGPFAGGHEVSGVVSSDPEQGEARGKAPSRE